MFWSFWKVEKKNAKKLKQYFLKKFCNIDEYLMRIACALLYSVTVFYSHLHTPPLPVYVKTSLKKLKKYFWKKTYNLSMCMYMFSKYECV